MPLRAALARSMLQIRLIASTREISSRAYSCIVKMKLRVCSESEVVNSRCGSSHKYTRNTFSLSSPIRIWLSDVKDAMEAREPTPETLPLRYMRKTA